MGDCTFCRLGSTRKKIAASSKHFWWKLDIHPVSPGHLLIVPKRHVTTLGELNGSEMSELLMSVQDAVGYIERLDLKTVYQAMLRGRATENSAAFLRAALVHPRIGTKPDGYNHGVNIGRAAGETIDHLHWHVIPRYEGDVPDPRGGVRQVIPGKGNYFEPRTQADIERSLDMDAENFFSVKRFEAHNVVPRIATRAHTCVKDGCRRDYTVRGQPEKQIRSVREFLGRYSNRVKLQSIPNFGRKSEAAARIVLYVAGLPVPEDWLG
jgi:diadenosine tetraphosphate (Ap4A) HIT family hydrolase